MKGALDAQGVFIGGQLITAADRKDERDRNRPVRDVLVMPRQGMPSIIVAPGLI
jgi:hypothetical protein